jgi:hypothetical protein
VKRKDGLNTRSGCACDYRKKDFRHLTVHSNRTVWEVAPVAAASSSRAKPRNASQEKPMCPQPKQPEAPMTKNHGSPATSGYYPVRGAPNSEFIELSRPYHPSLDETNSIEIRVLCSARENFPTYEVWTERTVYEFDRELCCTAVRDPHTGKAQDHHKCVGARMIGGRRVRNQVIDFSSPTPAIGHNALLGGDERPTIVTTTVTRVIMNVWRWSTSPRTVDTRSAR